MNKRHNPHNYEEVALLNCIFKGIVGSKLYGTDTPESDEDYVGIFMPNKEMLYGLNPCEQVSFDTNDSGSGVKNTSEDEDMTYYTLKRFFELAMKNNPNIVELFFIKPDKTVISTKIWEEVRDLYSLFISRKVFDSFFGYATSQEHLMKVKTERYLAVCATEELLKILIDQGHKKLDEETCKMLKETVKNFRSKKNVVREYIPGQYLEEIYEHIRIEKENYGHRRHNIVKHGFETKFGSHLVRLLYEGIELAQSGKIEFPLKMAETIKSIKEGGKTLNETLEIVDDLKSRFKKLEANCDLPEKPKTKEINRRLIELTSEYLAGNIEQKPTSGQS